MYPHYKNSTIFLFFTYFSPPWVILDAQLEITSSHFTLTFLPSSVIYLTVKLWLILIFSLLLVEGQVLSHSRYFASLCSFFNFIITSKLFLHRIIINSSSLQLFYFFQKKIFYDNLENLIFLIKFNMKLL